MRGLLRRLRELLDRRRMDRELDDELAAHLTMQIERHVSAGMRLDHARARALRELGLPEHAAEQVRDERTGAALDLWWRDLRRAVGSLRRAPVVSCLSAGATAVGIAAVAVLITLIHGVILTPLPFPRPDRLVHIADTNPEAGIARTGVASGNIADWRTTSRALAGVAGFYATGRTVSGLDTSGAEVLLTAQATVGFFDVLAVAPIIGRTFTEEEFSRGRFNSAAMPIGTDPVVVISNRVWRQRFAARTDLDQLSLTIERRPFRVIGVMPSSFVMPSAAVDLWLPWHVGETAPRDQHYLGAVARLRDDVTLAEAGEDLNRIARVLGERYPQTNRGWQVSVTPLLDETIGDTPGVLWTVFGAVGLALVVVCATVAILSLARGLDRRRDVAVRVALGASRARVVRETFLEAGVVTVAGGLIGLVITAGVLGTLPAWLPDVPRLADVQITSGVGIAVGVVIVLAALLAAAPQAWHVSRMVGTTALVGGRLPDGSRQHRLRDVLVVGQVALAVVLLVGAGLTVRTVQQLQAAPAGFDAAGVVVAPVFLDSTAYNTGAKVRAYYDELFTRLRQLPGVTDVGSGTTVPTGTLGPDFARPVWVEGRETGQIAASVRIVTPGYFPALRLIAREGRVIGEQDHPTSPSVVVVNESLARQMWPGQSAVGQQLVIDYSTAGTYAYDVIGVVGDVRHAGPRQPPRPEVFLAHAQRSYLTQNVVVRTSGDVQALTPQVRTVMVGLDRDKPPHAVTPLADLFDATYRRDRQLAVVLGAFSAGAVLLALLSVSAVLAHRVRERDREIGVRLALGASGAAVVRWLSAAGLRLVGAGLLLGTALSLVASTALRSRLFGVDRTDLTTYVVVLGVIVVAGTTALVVPALRALRVDPVSILRRG